MDTFPMCARSSVATLLTTVALVLAVPSNVADDVYVSHLYDLADFSGPLPLNSPRMYSDPVWDEIYVLYQGHVRIFNDSGMQVFSFGDDPSLGYIRDVVADRDGKIHLLSYDFSDPAVRTRYTINRCNYRGELERRVPVTGLPQEFSDLTPDRLFYAGGRLHLLGGRQLRLVTVDLDGRYLDGIDLEPYVIEDGERPDGLQIDGLAVEDDGTIVFSVAVKFRVFRREPDGKAKAFGEGGSSPGQFGVIAGVTTDAGGNIYVTDKLRNVVIMFDRDFRFLTEFGFRGAEEGGLVRPQDVVSDDAGKLYVTQVGNRGVAVFQVHSRPASENEVPTNDVSARVRKEVPFSQASDRSQVVVSKRINVPRGNSRNRLLRHGKTRRELSGRSRGNLTVATAGLPE